MENNLESSNKIGNDQRRAGFVISLLIALFSALIIFSLFFFIGLIFSFNGVLLSPGGGFNLKDGIITFLILFFIAFMISYAVRDKKLGKASRNSRKRI